MSSGAERRARGHEGARWWYLLLIPPFVGLLWLPLYARKGPELFGFPFFYWYQFAWVIAAAALTIIVYLATKASR
jgi:hypothetical protein